MSYMKRGGQSLGTTIARRFNHYQTLGVTKTASGAQIRSKFLELSKKYHPDRTRHLEEATQKHYTAKFKTIKEAYDTLRSTSKRRDYDLTLVKAGDESSLDLYGPTRDARGHARASTLHTRRKRQVYNYGRDYKRTDSHDPITRPFSGGSDSDVPHFDFERHYKSQRGYDEHRKRMDEQKQRANDGYRPGHHDRPWTLTPVGIGLAAFAVFLYLVR
jgi:DnaJ-class molecular chaperone